MASNRPAHLRTAASAFRVAALAASVAVSPVASAQRNPFEGGAVSRPWESLKLNPKTRVKLFFPNTSIDAIVNYYQNVSGITIVKDPDLTGRFNISSAKPVPLSEAFQILSTTLGLKGYGVRKDGNLLVIRKQDQGGGNRAPTVPDDPTPSVDNTSSLKVYPVNYANASQIARVINSVFADSGNSNFGGFGGRGPFGLDPTNTVDVEAAVQRPGGFGGGQGGRGGQGGNNRFNFGRQQSTTLVHADYDDYSNQVIVSAPDRFQSQVRLLVTQLDKPTDTPVQTKVYHLDFASATEAATTVQSVLNSNVPRGKGGATTGQTQGAGGFFSALRGQTAGSGTATADARTNNLVVTATPENIKTVDAVVKDLDRNVPTESTTFVFPLNNAKADEIATLFQNAFGTRTGINGGRTGSNNNNNNGNRTTTSVSSGNQRNRSGGRLGSEVVGNDLDLALANPDADSGDLATSVGVTQGFGQGFFGGGQGQNNRNGNASRTFGQNDAGQVVNTRDLSNQVTAIADQNTNSLIVVTSPENAAIVKRILDQLDKIPEQVLIETVIVEASLTAADKLGVTFNASSTGNTTTSIGGVFNNVQTSTTTNTTTGTTTTAGNEGFQYALTGTNYGVFLNALKQDTKFQVLSSPKIYTSNGVQASINISQSIPYITSSIQSTLGTVSNSYQFLDVGIVLTVTPRITSNGFVSMDVVQTANDLQGYTTFNAPIVNQREADTRVSVRDGETVILGGIIRKTVTVDRRKIPVLGDIPVLGQLFRSTTKENAKTELLVFMTPRIVRDPADAQRIRRENEQKMSQETRRGLEEYRQTGNNDSGQRTKTGEPNTEPLKDPAKNPPPANPTKDNPPTTPPKKGG